MKPPPCFDDRQTKPIVAKICRDNGIDIQLITELCEVAQKYSGSGRKEGVTSDITTCIDAFLERTASSGTK